MTKLIILGSSNAIPDKDHENTHMVIVDRSRTVLIDCVGNPILRLEQAGVDLDSITDLILTHFHPDHVSGVPLLLMNMWLMGRSKALSVYGLDHTLERMENLMRSYSWEEWPDFFPIAFYRLPALEYAPIIDTEIMKIVASPVHHMIPAIGLRVDFKQTNKSMAYSCDTEPCEEVRKLAQGVDVLIHEAAGNFLGHSSAAQAGEVARMSEAGSLYLIHYPTGKFTSGDLVAEAHKKYPGTVVLAQDFMEIDF